jgi:mediator of RNA polymerase II transcription subunit 4
MDIPIGTTCSTRVKLLSLIEDIEIVARELIEFLTSSKPSRQDDIDPGQLIELLKIKDEEFQETLKTAKLQAAKQKEFDLIKAEVERRDFHIKQLQRNLMESESILATAIYQAKQKLEAIRQANQHKISSEELIRYAHKISAGNTVAAPPTWLPGDPRRPYPTEVDMRGSLLCRSNDMSGASSSMAMDSLMAGRGGHMPFASQHSIPMQPLTWQPSTEVQSTTLARLPSHCLPIDSTKSHPKDTEEVEMMSSDSSSSSSSDE